MSLHKHAYLMTLVLLSSVPLAMAADWASDPVWHDGLVEKAVYASSRVVYGKPRAYEMIVFTNKEQHDVRTLTKADKSADTIEVWKHNQIEVIPTPNYDYKYETTSHLTVGELKLTRLDCSSQEFCGTSFKQYQRLPTGGLSYWSFSYMPEAGRAEGQVRANGEYPVVAADSLPLWLRAYDFQAKPTVKLAMLPSQKNNRPTPAQPVFVEVRHAGEESGSHKLELYEDDKLLGTYWMANDRLHVMTKYQSADGQQSYELKDLSRVNYWTIKGE